MLTISLFNAVIPSLENQGHQIFGSKSMLCLPRFLSVVTAISLCFSINLPLEAQSFSTQDEVKSLVERLRSNKDRAHGGWKSNGTSTGMLVNKSGIVLFAGDDEGRFRLQLDSSFKMVDLHDTTTTTKLYPWGTVVDVEGEAEELTVIPLWVATGYWLTKNAPLKISPGPERSDGRIALIVKHRQGSLPFEVLLDANRELPISVKTATGIPMTVWQFENHHDFNGWPIAGTIRLLKGGREFLKLELDEPKALSDRKVWAKPQPTSKFAFDGNVAKKLQTRNDGQGYLFVRPIINGQQLGWFLFDTGAPATILGTSAVRQLGLAGLGQTQSTGVGGNASIQIHRVDSIQLGPVTVGPVSMASMNVQRLGWRNLPIEGIIGSDILHSVVVEYEIASSTIQFHDPAEYQLPENTKWQRISLSEGKPIVVAKFEGHEGDFLIDTAAGGTLSMSKHLVDRLDLLRKRKTRSAQTAGVGGRVTMRRGQIASLSFGGKPYKNVTTLFSVANQGSYAHPYPDGIIGINLLDDYRLVFELSKKRMAFLGRQ